jgi:DNA polymerase-3 subunit delta'
MDTKTLEKNLEIVIGHQSAKNFLMKAVSAGRARVFLLVGPPHMGKGLLARIVAASLHGQTDINRAHSDTVCFADIMEANKGEKEENRWKKSADDLVKFLNRSPINSKIKVAIIDEVDKLNNSAANALLKNLEEPSKSTVIILTANSIEGVLPTIRSRAQIIQLNYVADAEIREFVIAQTKDKIEEIVIFANGAIGMAKALLLDKALLQKHLDYLDNFKILLRASVAEGFKITNIKDRSEVVALLSVWLNLSRRLTLAKLSASENNPVMIELGKITSRGAEDLMALTDEIRKSIDAIEVSTNIQIVMEALILKWAWGMTKTQVGYNLGQKKV